MFNPMTEQLFGIPAAQAIGTSLDQFVPARFRSAQAMYARCSLIRSLCDRALVISPPDPQSMDVMAGSAEYRSISEKDRKQRTAAIERLFKAEIARANVPGRRADRRRDTEDTHTLSFSGETIRKTRSRLSSINSSRTRSCPVAVRCC
jgi:hypothetical protein